MITQFRSSAHSRSLSPPSEDARGFSLIELIVAVAIIAIIAAVAIPVFLNQRTKAARSALESDMHSAIVELSTIQLSNPPGTRMPASASAIATVRGGGWVPTSNGFPRELRIATNCSLTVAGATGDNTSPPTGTGVAHGQFVVMGAVRVNSSDPWNYYFYDSVTGEHKIFTAALSNQWTAVGSNCGYPTL